MKVVLIKTMVFVIELPLIVCIVMGFLLLVLLHLVNSSPLEDPEEEAHGMPKEPKDNLWQL